MTWHPHQRPDIDGLTHAVHVEPRALLDGTLLLLSMNQWRLTADDRAALEAQLYQIIDLPVAA